MASIPIANLSRVTGRCIEIVANISMAMEGGEFAATEVIGIVPSTATVSTSQSPQWISTNRHQHTDMMLVEALHFLRLKFLARRNSKNRNDLSY